MQKRGEDDEAKLDGAVCGFGVEEGANADGCGGAWGRREQRDSVELSLLLQQYLKTLAKGLNVLKGAMHGNVGPDGGP